MFDLQDNLEATERTRVVEVMRPKDEGELCKLLRERIRTYKKAHPRLSSQQIAKRFGMTTSSFNRIENMDILSPGIEQVVKVLKGTGNLDELVEFMNKFFPEISSTYFDFYARNKSEESGDLLCEYLRKEKYFLVLIITMVYGISENDLIKALGKNGLEIADELVEKGLVTIKDSYYTNATADFWINDETTIELFKNTISSFGSDYNSNDYDRQYCIDFLSCDKHKVLPEVMKILRKARQDIVDLVDQDKNNGKDVLFLGFVGDIIFEGIKDE
jgi:transcriptional regulator with XRE-family HTH domain